MNKKVAAITYLYDYTGAPLLRKNYQIFRKSWEENTDIPLYSVECLLADQKPFISDAIHYQVKDPFIHKETCINNVVKNLPDSIDTVIWIDGDVIFEDYSHLNTLRDYFQDGYKAVQLATKLRHLGEDGLCERIRVSFTKNSGKGYQGMAWSAPRDFFDIADGLYSGCPMGGHDSVFLMGIYGRILTEKWQAHLNVRLPYIKRDIIDWVDKVYPYFQHEATCLPGAINHLFHGHLKNRLYLEKHHLIEIDKMELNRDSNGFLQFKEDNLEKRQRVLDYWKARELPLVENSDLIERPKRSSELINPT